MTEVKQTVNGLQCEGRGKYKKQKRALSSRIGCAKTWKKQAVMWLEAVPGTGKVVAGRPRDFMPRPPVASGTSHIMELLRLLFFKEKDSRLSVEGDDDYWKFGENVSCDFSCTNHRITKSG